MGQGMRTVRVRPGSAVGSASGRHLRLLHLAPALRRPDAYLAAARPLDRHFLHGRDHQMLSSSRWCGCGGPVEPKTLMTMTVMYVTMRKGTF